MIGFMCTGKSTVGPLLAARCERRFVDLDAVIEAEAQATVKEIFAAEGEKGFRAREAAALRRVAGEGPQVIAVGGGCPVYGDNMEIMLAAGQVVCLTASPDEIAARAGDTSTRPLLAGQHDVRAEVVRLMEARQPHYARAHLTVDTTGRPPSQVARKIAEELGAWG